jgi:multiple sugar transport system permease protein
MAKARANAAQPALKRLPQTWVWITPLLLALSLATLFPALGLIALALSRSSLGHPLRAWLGAGNFLAALGDAEFLLALLRSGLFSLLSSLLELVFGGAIALLVFATARTGRWLLTLYLLPLMTPPIMVGVAWKLILAPAGGLLNGLLQRAGIAAEPISFLGGTGWPWLSIGIADAWQWTPFMALLIFGALLGIPHDVLEAAVLDGASAWARLRFIIAPMLLPTLSTLLLLKLIIGFKLFDLVFILTFGGPGFETTTAAFNIWRLAFEQFDVGQAAARTLIYGIIVSIAILPVVWLKRRAERHAA